MIVAVHAPSTKDNVYELAVTVPTESDVEMPASKLARSLAVVMPTYVPWSEKYASAAGSAARTFDFAAPLSARVLNPREEGTAIASNTPMITRTIRISINVNPSVARGGHVASTS